MRTITAVIPVLNRAHVVDRAIASALSQELPLGFVMNVMVVDDGSSDDLAAALRPFGSRITCLRHDRNKGAAAARNTGIEAADGDYVAFLDSDDIWLPGKILTQIAFMQDRAYLASCTAYVLTRPGTQRIVSPTYKTGKLGLIDLTWGCYVSPGSTLVCARDVFRQIGDFDTKLQRLEDWDWLLRYVSLHDLGFLAMPLASIEVGPNRDASKVLNALDRIKSSHATRFSPHQLRQFLAALEIERAAAHFRSGHSFAALPALIASLVLVPIGNRALAAVLYNRLWRG